MAAEQVNVHRFGACGAAVIKKEVAVGVIMGVMRYVGRCAAAYGSTACRVSVRQQSVGS